MQEKPTAALEQELSACADLRAYLKTNTGALCAPGLPALLLAAKMHYRTTHGGLDVPMASGAAADAAARAVAVVGHDGIGELLLALVEACHAHGVDPESALRSALRGYADRVRAAEADTR